MSKDKNQPENKNLKIDNRHPRDKYITVYGKKPVMEALADFSLQIDKLVIDKSYTEKFNAEIKELLQIAKRRSISIDYASTEHITKLARNGRQHQGVLADVIAPAMNQLSELLPSITSGAIVLLLDELHNPSNVGLIIRSAVAAGVSAVILPRKGGSDVNPLVVKASAGVAFKATIARCETSKQAVELLKKNNFWVIGLDANGDKSIYQPYFLKDQSTNNQLMGNIALVVGNETNGISQSIVSLVDEFRYIPMSSEAESLNASTAAAVAMFEVMRQLNYN